MRGRNRRGPNPLTRSYESNGPDVKVRGTAQHVTEKYTQLARDAHVSGDRVMAENYLQHAEHYYRIITAAHQSQLAQQNGTVDEREDEDDDYDTASDRFTFRSIQQTNPQQPGQPGFGGERGPGELGDGLEGNDGEDGAPVPTDPRPNNRNDRNDRQFRGNRAPDRNQDRPFRPNNDRDRNRERFDPNRPRRPQPDLEGAEQPILPAFLTAPTRTIPIETPEPEPAPVVDGEAVSEEMRASFRARRRRRPRIAREGGEETFEPETPGVDQV
jgi:hypothetical protein